MNGIASRLALLQYGDSFFPSGAVSFSWGLEGLAERGAISGPSTVEAFITGQLRARWAPYDRTIVAAAHAAAGDLAAVADVDRMVEVTTLAAELRQASCRMGGALLMVFARLGKDEAIAYRSLVADGAAHGHLGAMQGLLWGAEGLTAGDAIALSAHGFCTGLLGAAVRLGCITHLDAQAILTQTRKQAARLARQPLVPLNAITTHAPEAEIAAMHHRFHDARLFAN